MGIEFDERQASQYVFPAIDPVNSYTTVKMDSSLTEHLGQIKEAILRISKNDIQQRESLSNYLSQSFECTEAFTGKPGEDISINRLVSELPELLKDSM